jgi:hypothetical protein
MTNKQYVTPFAQIVRLSSDVITQSRPFFEGAGEKDVYVYWYD